MNSVQNGIDNSDIAAPANGMNNVTQADVIGNKDDKTLSGPGGDTADIKLYLHVYPS